MNVRLVKINELTAEMIAIDRECFEEMEKFIAETKANPNWPDPPKQKRTRGPNKPKPPEALPE